MGFPADFRSIVGLFPALKILTTTIPLTFFDFFTDIYTVALYAASPAAVVKTAAVILGKSLIRHRSLNLFSHSDQDCRGHFG